MKKRFSIFTQIWLPYTIIILVILSVLFIYYPIKQKQLLTEYKIAELTQQSSSLAISVETSLDRDDLSGLEKTMTRLKSSSKLTCISYVFTDDKGNVEMCNSLPSSVNHFNLLKDTEHYMTVKSKFKTDNFDGYVMISSSKAQLNSDIDKLNRPIFIILLLIGILVIFVVYWLAKIITVPINQVKLYAQELKDGNYELEFDSTKLEAIELYDLRQWLFVLSKKLKEQFDENKKLTEGLEDKVRIRTQEISKKNSYLEHAAKILRHDMHSGINTYIPRGLNSLDRRISEEKQKELKIDTSLRMIREGLKHTQKVYKGVYEFTNLVKKDVVLNRSDYNIKDILEDYLSATAYRPQVIIEDLDILSVNEPLFCTAIDNLIRNGLKYNDSLVKVVKIYRKNNYIYVEDNGRGMTSDDFRLLSQPYTRKEGQKETGSGLGLNICVAILEEHGFSISCEKLSQGTQLKIKISK
jgi:signal transduction histidine kinase